MAAKDIYASRHRGLTQPAEGSVKCEVCGCCWIPDASCFGCPGCEMLERFEIYHQNDPHWPRRIEHDPA